MAGFVVLVDAYSTVKIAFRHPGTHLSYEILESKFWKQFSSVLCVNRIRKGRMSICVTYPRMKELHACFHIWVVGWGILKKICLSSPSHT